MRRTLPATAFLLASFASSGAVADVEFKTGQFVKQTRHWDHETNSFRSGADEGEGDGCWLIIAVGAGSIKTKLISGRVKPWWSDEVLKIGSHDEWFDSDNFREANPRAAPLTMTRKIFIAVPSC